MKNIFLLLLTLFISSALMAQITPPPPPPGVKTAPVTPATPPPLPIRQVSGIVKDKDGTGLPGAVIRLTSIKDTLAVSTDADGIFVFKEVKRATFTISVSQLGQVAFAQKYFNNDLAKKVVLDPIELKPKSTELKEVVINGTPTVIYKVDTVEFQASDYKVRENATVDELLKKIDGMEVGRDGTLTFQGQEIKRANLNGQAFAGGNVAQAIKTLPADIVKKAQVVDDYGEVARRTGVKDKAPEKVLNLTTKDDRSVGTYGTLTTQGGNNDRYNARLSAFRINANRNTTLIGRFENTVTGVGGTGAGITRSGSPTLSYTDQLKKTRINGSYSYNFNDNKADNLSYGENYSYGLNNVKNISVFNRQSTTQNNSTGHNLNYDMRYEPTKKHSIQIRPRYNYSSSTDNNIGLTENLNYFTTGFEHLVSNTNTINKNQRTDYGLSLIYTYYLENKTSVTVQGSIGRSENTGTGDAFSNFKYYADSTRNVQLKDSTARLFKTRKGYNTTYSAGINYGIYIFKTGQLRFSYNINKTINDDNSVSDTLAAGGVLSRWHQLDNISNFAFTEHRVNVNYYFKWGKMDVTMGVDGLPTTLEGTKIDNNNGQTITTKPRNNFRTAPSLRLYYAFSQTERASLNYSGSNQMPDFSQLQPFTDRSDPNNIITGNPNLKIGFTNYINADYNKYIANSKVTIAFNVNAAFYQDQVAYNTVQVATLISTNPDKYKTINQTTFINLNGSNSAGGNYTLSKRIKNSTFALNGSVNYSYNVAMSNNVVYHNTNWRVNQRFGPQLSFNDDRISFSPYVGVNLNRNFTTLAGATPTFLTTTQLALDGRFYFLKKWNTNFTATKNYVSGLRNFDANPLVINMGMERSFFAKNNLRVTFNVFDLLHQNNFLQQTVNAQGVTNTLSNAQSRYFLIGLSLNLQKWGGTPTRGGKILQRRGDGSFIYE